VSGGFLARWVRRKDEARRAQRPPAQPEAAPVAPPPVADGRTARAAEPELTPEDIAALPKVEALRADSDVTAFLRRGVPEALRNAALRKIWMLDPAIRDFAGHARDYDYDWNAPGGAPGSGALEPGDDVPAMVRRIFGEPDAPPAGATERGGRDRVASAPTDDAAQSATPESGSAPQT
jgi:hypothetical protein